MQAGFKSIAHIVGSLKQGTGKFLFIHNMQQTLEGIRNRDHKRLRMKEKKIRSPEESIIEKQPNWAKKTRKK